MKIEKEEVLQVLKEMLSMYDKDFVLGLLGETEEAIKT